MRESFAKKTQKDYRERDREKERQKHMLAGSRDEKEQKRMHCINLTLLTKRQDYHDTTFAAAQPYTHTHTHTHMLADGLRIED